MTKSLSPLEGTAAERVDALTPENPHLSSGRKPRLLIVGAGMMGREHLRVSQLLGWADVQGIVDPDGGALSGRAPTGAYSQTRRSRSIAI